MKGQVEAITLVLIGGIVIALVGGAYLWGKPLIEKRTAVTDISSSIRFMEDLDQKIVDLAKSCTGSATCEQSINLPSKGFVTIDTADNSLSYEFLISQPLVTENEIPINTRNVDTVARFGETPSVIWMSGMPVGDQYKILFRIKYRELLDNDQKKGYMIKLSGIGRGTNRIVVSYDGNDVISDPMGNDLVVTNINVRLI
jgi:hypothetical protein